MVVVAQIDVSGLQIQSLHTVMHFSLVAMDDAQVIGRDDGDLVLGQVDNLVRIADQRRGIAGDKMLVFADADHQRAAMAGRDDHVG